MDAVNRTFHSTLQDIEDGYYRRHLKRWPPRHRTFSYRINIMNKMFPQPQIYDMNAYVEYSLQRIQQRANVMRTTMPTVQGFNVLSNESFKWRALKLYLWAIILGGLASVVLLVYLAISLCQTVKSSTYRDAASE